MALITKTKSGLKIEKWGNKYVVSKGNQTEVYGSYAAMVSGLTPRQEESKPKRHKAKPVAHKAKPASKPRKARKSRKRRAKPTVIYQAAPKPRKKHHRVKRNAAGQAVNKHGHKRGCKCLVCSPATRKKALAARKRNAKGASKPHKVGKKRRGGGRAHSRPQPRPRPQKAEIYRGDVSRFNGHGLTRRMPARMPYGYLSSGRN